MPLVQIPFSAAIYFCYAAPFLLLAALAVTRCSSTQTHWVHPVVLGSYLLFAVVWTNTNYVWTLGTTHARYTFVSASILPRAGITMTAGDRAEYANVVALIHQVNGSKRYIYAAPDCPEVYFLSETQNPTRTLYEFLHPAMTVGETLAMLDREEIDVVVINQGPEFSRPLDRSLVQAFEQRYPYSAPAASWCGGGCEEREFDLVPDSGTLQISGRFPCAARRRRLLVPCSGDHDFSRLDDRQCIVAATQLQRPDGIGGDDRSQRLVANPQANLRQESIDAHFFDEPVQPVSRAQAFDRLVGV
jgi:hypothetical protein